MKKSFNLLLLSLAMAAFLVGCGGDLPNGGTGDGTGDGTGGGDNTGGNDEAVVVNKQCPYYGNQKQLDLTRNLIERSLDNYGKFTMYLSWGYLGNRLFSDTYFENLIPPYSTQETEESYKLITEAKDEDLKKVIKYGLKEMQKRKYNTVPYSIIKPELKFTPPPAKTSNVGTGTSTSADTYANNVEKWKTTINDEIVKYINEDVNQAIRKEQIDKNVNKYSCPNKIATNYTNYRLGEVIKKIQEALLEDPSKTVLDALHESFKNLTYFPGEESWDDKDYPINLPQGHMLVGCGSNIYNMQIAARLKDILFDKYNDDIAYNNLLNELETLFDPANKDKLNAQIEIILPALKNVLGLDLGASFIHYTILEKYKVKTRQAKVREAVVGAMQKTNINQNVESSKETISALVNAIFDYSTPKQSTAGYIGPNSMIYDIDSFGELDKKDTVRRNLFWSMYTGDGELVTKSNEILTKVSELVFRLTRTNVSELDNLKNIKFNDIKNCGYYDGFGFPNHTWDKKEEDYKNAGVSMFKRSK